MWIPDIIHPSQQCGVAGKTILDAATTIRDANAYAETRHEALCVLSLEFQAAFDNISHTYLYATLEAHGFSAGFQENIRSMYDGARHRFKLTGTYQAPSSCSVAYERDAP
jgi:hypothetical protein